MRQRTLHTLHTAAAYKAQPRSLHWAPLSQVSNTSSPTKAAIAQRTVINCKRVAGNAFHPVIPQH